LQNRGIDYGNQNKRRKLVEMLDKELTQETLEKEGNHILYCDFSTPTIINFLAFLGSRLRNRSMSNKEYNIR
jgi:hypothetical protein